MRARVLPTVLVVLFITACSHHGVMPPLSGGALPQAGQVFNATPESSSLTTALVGPPYGTNLPLLQYAISTASSAPQGMAIGSDGNIWFVESAANRIARSTSTGSITEYAIPTSNSQPVTIASGAAGTLWFTEYNAGAIGRITTAGAFATYHVPTASSHPHSIVLGPDGNVWFTESTGNKIGRLTAAGSFHEFSLPHLGSTPLGITVGPDNNLWFAEASGRIGRITTAGAITEFTVAGHPRFITSAADGALWYTESNNAVGRITTTGISRTIALASGASPAFITRGSDGNPWFTEIGANQIRYVDVKTGTLAPPFAAPASSKPNGIVALNGNIYFTEYSGNNVAEIVLQAARGLSGTIADIGANLYPAALNRYGVVVGKYENGSTSTDKAFMYSSGKVTYLGMLPGDTTSSANDVNASNEAVGVSGTHAVLFKSGTIVNLDKAGSATATALNDYGKLVGYDAAQNMVSFDGKGGTTNLGNAFPPCVGTYPMAVNNSGEIVGSGCETGTPPPDLVYDAFKYAPFAIVTYPSDFVSPDDYRASANDVNANGDIAGVYPNGYGLPSAFIAYASGKSLALPPALDSSQYGPWVFSEANALNTTDWIVGSSYVSAPTIDTPQEAILFISGTTYDLNWLVPRTSGWFLTNASDINDSGKIVGWGTRGGVKHAFVMTVTKP